MIIERGEMMRLWHYKLIPVLPNTMLVSQWRECIAIKRQWEKGTLKHRLVSYVMNYDKKYFFNYTTKVMMELSKRDIRHNINLLKEIAEYSIKNENDVLESNFCYYPEHNNRYLKQCYYNLQEKYDRGIIAKEEWQKIEDLIGKEV